MVAVAAATRNRNKKPSIVIAIGPMNAKGRWSLLVVGSDGFSTKPSFCRSEEGRGFKALTELIWRLTGNESNQMEDEQASGISFYLRK